MADLKSLSDLLVHKLRKMYDVEQRLADALPKLSAAAASQELKRTFTEYLRQTETHLERLGQLFGLFGAKAKGDTSDAIEGLVRAAEEAIGLDADGSVRDAALIGVTQEAEHFEIAAYGTLRTWARVLGKLEAVQLLDWTLDDEKQTDHRLTQLAENLNFQAATTRFR